MANPWCEIAQMACLPARYKRNGGSEKTQRDYLVPSCPAISQNIYMYPRAGEVIETAGQLGSCPQKVLATNY